MVMCILQFGKTGLILVVHCTWMTDHNARMHAIVHNCV